MLKRLYRKLFCRKGYGVHSPFVFDLITNVIGQQCAFYAYHDMARIRRRLSENDQTIQYRGKRTTVKKVLQRYGISKKEGEFLFRLSNHFKPQTILSIGSSFGLTPLSLTKYDSSVQCIVLENEPDIANIATQLLCKETNLPPTILTGSYPETIPEAIAQLQQIDCIFMGKDIEIKDLNAIFSQCIPLVHDDTFCVLAGIRSSSDKYRCWQQLHQHQRITAAIDLYDMGLLFFQPKLHKRVYKTILS